MSKYMRKLTPSEMELVTDGKRPSAGQGIADLCGGLPAKVLLHPFHIGLVSLVQLHDVPEPRPANRIKRPHGQVQI